MTKTKKKGFVGFRLHDDRDQDIIEDMERFKNTTDRWKDVYRLAMKVERGEVALPQPETPAQTASVPSQKPGNDPKQARVRSDVKPAGKGSSPVAENILQGF